MAARNPFASSVPDIFDPYGLVQSRRPVHSTGYYFLRNLLMVGAVAGGVVALYRNDVFRELARRVGQEQRYLEAEKFLVGTPGWGTPRSMEPVLNPEGDSAAASTTTPGSDSPAATTTTAAPTTDTGGTADGRAAALASAPAAQLVAAPVASPTTATAQPRARGADSLAPIAFDSLPVGNRGGTVRTAATVEPTPARTFAPAPVRAPTPAPVAHAAAPRPAPVDHTRVKAIKVSLDETPEPASHRSVPLPTRAAPPPEPAPAPAPKPVAAKPTPSTPKASAVHEGDNPLLAAVRGAVRTHPAKSSVPAAE